MGIFRNSIQRNLIPLKTGRQVGALLICAVAAVLTIAGSASAQTSNFFDWQDQTNLPPNSGSNGAYNYVYIPAPILTDSDISAVQTYFSNALTANPSAVLAVKLTGPILSTTASAIFNNYNVSYVFGDFEGSGTANTSGPYGALDASYATMVSQVQGSTKSGSALISGFPLSPLNTDRTNPNPTGGPTAADFQASNLNMTSEVLYGGDASFKTPSQLGGTSNAPNIRSNLFILPLTRFSEVQTNTGGMIPNIPYVSRFNDANNSAFATGGTVNGIPQFVTNDPSNTTTYNQLLSRDDFQALMLHLRMRGAASFQLLDPGVAGYTVAQMESDAATGWLGGTTNAPAAAALNAMFASSTERPLTQATTINVDGNQVNMEQAGVVYSGITTGITNNNPPPTGPQLAILISNLDDNSHTVAFGTIALGTLSTSSFLMSAHSHELLQFTRNGSVWDLQSTTTMFSDGTAMTTGEGIGVPEPASVGLLGMLGFAMLVRRRRKA